MIDVIYFQNLLLLVCVLGVAASLFVFSATEMWGGRWYKRFAFRAFALVLGVSSGMAGVLLVLLK